MWHGQDTEQQAIQTISGNGDAGTGETYKAGIAGGQVLAAAAAPSSAAGGCSAQDCSWERDAVNAAVAAGVVLEELQRDVQLQVGTQNYSCVVASVMCDCCWVQHSCARSCSRAGCFEKQQFCPAMRCCNESPVHITGEQRHTSQKLPLWSHMHSVCCTL
jgi:hypothetical protein